MRRTLILTVIFLLALASIHAQSLTVLIYNETDRVSLDVLAKDPDLDALTTSYEDPLNSRGVWQTDFGDAGVYDVNITVSDGTLIDSQMVRLLVLRKDVAPTIVSSRPRSNVLEVDEGKELRFTIRATDSNKDSLAYTWFLDGEDVESEEAFAYAPDFADAGSHIVSIEITDGLLTTSYSWNVTVLDVDLDSILFGGFRDFSVSEGDVVHVPLADYRYYGLNYTFSGLASSSRTWQTDYSSAGQYNLTLAFFGKEYYNKETVTLTVLNTDRPPIIAALAPQTLYEGKEFSLSFSATDLDNDSISYSIAQLPDGATFSGNTFRWTPTYDTIIPSATFGASLARSFHLLSVTIPLTVNATSNGLSSTFTVPLTVFNWNREPTLTAPALMSFKEGEAFNPALHAEDPDHDVLFYSLEGPLRIGQTIPFDMAGTHHMSATVSDEFFSSTAFFTVAIEDVNQAPQIGPFEGMTLPEGYILSAPLNPSDPDNDALTLSIVEGPQSATIVGNTLYWMTPFDVSTKTHDAIVPFTIQATDGELTSQTSFSITVTDVNQPPELIGGDITTFAVKRNVPTILYVNATDVDNDALSYEWSFGTFDRHISGALHQRTFSTTGVKEAQVVVSDGEESVTKKLRIIVS